jgi:Xaa-Pro aminopeptidase
LHEAVHANGANIDNLESRDERLLLPNSSFTIEPGVYLPGKFGVRSEINIYLDATRATVTGVPRQTAPILI